MNYLECVKQAEKCSTTKLQEMMNNLSNGKTKNNIDKFIKFINYSKTDLSKEFFNALEFVNINENSITKLLAWLLDINWMRKENINIEESINYKFCKSFFELINKKSKEQGIKGLIDASKAEHINALHDDNYGDILLKTENEDFICVIENKKLAKFSTDIKTDNIIQIERYYQNAEINYPNATRKYVYICALCEHMKSKYLKDHVNDPNNCKFHGKNLNPNLTIKEALEDCEYVTIEHSEIVVLLYEILKKIHPEKFDEFGILKPATSNDMLKMAEQLNNIRNNSIAKINTLKLFGEKRLKDGLKNEIDYCIKNKEFFTNRVSINEKLELQIGANGDIEFYSKLSNTEIDIVELLCRYIEYFELHCDVGNYHDNLPGYTKIIDGKFIYKVCCELYDDNIYKNLPKNIQLLINNIKNIDEIVWMSV